MLVYLPIAEISFNIFLLLGIGAAVGFLSGMFGVGGGFLMTPLLIFNGIPAAVAVSTGANQIVASSVSGTLAHWRRKAVDIKMGLILLSGGLLGSLIGVFIFQYLRKLGLIDVVISLAYVVFLGAIGSLMLYESVRAIVRSRGDGAASARASHHSWIHGLPFKMRFPQSRLYISAIPPFCLGAVTGILASIMGVGGNFFLVPVMIYVLRMPTNVVVGTSLFQGIFVMAFTTILQSTANKTVDIVLALFLIVGGVIGAQAGAAVGQKLRGDYLRALLAVIVLAVGIRLAFDLSLRPHELFSLDLLKRPIR
ncbi:MAG: sulfite exporter TauE/SafE family protein [Alphaproteobacteria bacterium]